jgi:pimeloyl-ACP methyl ester carboxylesterase
MLTMGARDPSVVLLHASASSGRQWQDLAAALAPRYRVHAVDLHGHGERAPWPGPTPLTLADDAALAAPLLAQDGGVHLVGHSYGGAVALKLAALHPLRVRSVALYEPVMFRWLLEEGAAEVTDIIEVAREMRAASNGDAARIFIDFWSGAGAWASLSPARKESIASRVRAVAAHFHALFAETLALRDVARLPMAMTFMTGARTARIMQRLAELVRGGLPGAQHCTIAQAGHMGPLTHAESFNAHVLDFLEQEARIAA